jgi:hypothetical protein
MYNNSMLKKPFKASAAILPYTLVMFGSADDTVSQATSASSLVIGATAEIGITTAEVTAGSYVDVVLCGIAEIKAGANVTRGQKLISNGSGQVITAAASAGVNVQTIGIAMKSGVTGEIIPVLLSQGVMQG